MKNFSLQSYKMLHERKIKPDMSDKTRIKELNMEENFKL